MNWIKMRTREVVMTMVSSARFGDENEDGVVMKHGTVLVCASG